MPNKLYLLDGMALAYRAHFAFIRRPILTSKGVNSSALYGFALTLLDILEKQKPTHLAVAFDTAAPTDRHKEFADYKAQREEMPEDLSAALPHIDRLIEGFNIPVLKYDGYEADDVIGTLVTQAAKEGFESYMVTSDKDFGQLVNDKTFIYKPGRAGDDAETLGVEQIKQRWNIQRPEQVVDILALMGDASDNIPGVPGIGEKTAMKLIGQFGTLDALLERTGELTGKLKENLVAHRDAALLSRRLATIQRDVPCKLEIEGLVLRPRDDEKLKDLFAEFEFNSLGRRLFGNDFKAGRGFATPAPAPTAPAKSKPAGASNTLEFDFGQETKASPTPIEPAPTDAAEPRPANLKTIADVPHDYKIAATKAERAKLIRELLALESFCFDTETTGLDPRSASLVGMSFSWKAHTGWYVPVPPDDADAAAKLLEEFRPVFESETSEKVGHNLKFDLSILKWQGMDVRGKFFDTMLAHSLVEPDLRHGMDYLSEVYLGYTPIPITNLLGQEKTPLRTMATVPLEQIAEYAAEDADVTWQLRSILAPLLKEKAQERVFFEVESPLVPVLVDMEHAGIKLDADPLEEFSAELAKEMDVAEKTIWKLAGTEFKLNSPKQLGQILFDILKISGAPKKTRTGQYATDEQTLALLANDHEIVRRLLEYRAATKLKSTYTDALPATIWPATGRIHTTFNQAVTSTGRLNSQDPNLQNIPIRTERGQEIRKAFVPRDPKWRLLSADYSQIELRIIAALAKEAGLLEAFRTGADVHQATAAKVYGIAQEAVTSEMRRKAKMVNYGIAYGISAFGLAQRLQIPRSEGAEIIAQYFKQFPGIRRYMDDTIAQARERGYVETVTGRRRYLRDIRSANNTVRGSAERNAINMPIQGTAADMIKIAMSRIHRELAARRLKTQMVLQVHDELLFDLHPAEEKEVRGLVRDKMENAIPLEVPIEVEIGVGENWLAAH